MADLNRDRQKALLQQLQGAPQGASEATFTMDRARQRQMYDQMSHQAPREGFEPAPYDPRNYSDEQRPLFEPGLKSPRMRADLSLNSKFEDRKKKAQEGYNTELRQVTSGGVQRDQYKNEAGNWVDVDSPTVSLPEMAGDVADVAGDAPAAIAGAASALATGGASIPVAATIAAGLGFIADAAKRVIERLRGYNSETLGENVAGAAGAGAMEAGGVVLGEAGNVIANVAKGAGAEAVSPATKAAVEFQNQHKLPPLMAPQVSGFKLAKRAFQQARELFSNIDDRFNEQHKQVYDLVTGFTDRNIPVPDNLWALLDSGNKKYRKALIDAASNPNVSMQDGGNALGELAKTYADSSQARVQQLYKQAEAEATPKFDLGGLKKTAQAMLIPKEAEGIPQTVQSIIKGPDGKPLTKEVPTKVGVSDLPEGKVLDVANRIMQLNPDMAAVNGLTPTQQLIELRKQLWELTQPAPGDVVREPQAQARRLYNALTDALDNPTEGATDSWKLARTAARERFETLDNALVTQLFKMRDGKLMTTPEEMANALGGKLKVTHIETLEKLAGQSGDAGKGYMERFKGSLKSNILERAGNGEDIASVLAQMDNQTKTKLFSGNDLKEFEHLSVALGRMQDSGIQKTLDGWRSDGNIVESLLSSNNEAGITQLTASLATDPNALRKMEKGAIQRLFDSAVKKTDNDAALVDPKLLEDEYQRYKALGLVGPGKIIPPETAKVIEGSIKYIWAASNGMKIGGGDAIVAAETSTGVMRLEAKAIAEYIRYGIMAKLMTTRMGEKLFVGSGKDPVKPALGRSLGTIALNMVDQIATEAKLSVPPGSDEHIHSDRLEDQMRRALR